jgi:hypothetical protein
MVLEGKTYENEKKSADTIKPHPTYTIQGKTYSRINNTTIKLIITQNSAWTLLALI